MIVPRINGWTIDTIIKTWQNDLKVQSNHFIQHASQVRHWDNQLLNNTKKLISLQKQVAKVVEAQTSLDVTLEKIRVCTFFVLAFFIFNVFVEFLNRTHKKILNKDTTRNVI